MQQRGSDVQQGSWLGIVVVSLQLQSMAACTGCAACFSGRGFAAWLGIDVCMLAGVSGYVLWCMAFGQLVMGQFRALQLRSAF